MFKQMSQPFENVFSEYQCGAQNGLSTQKCFVEMLEKWKRSASNNKMCFSRRLIEGFCLPQPWIAHS